MKVVKFGGSSVANAEQISKVIDIVTAEADRKIVVVSAPGKRHGDDTKVTDLLIALTNVVLEGGDYENPNSFHLIDNDGTDLDRCAPPCRRRAGGWQCGARIQFAGPER